ncbi:MAG: YihY/virulence factor BrkB family protein [Coriobacteriia bacterium]|nr:YihY/virulence factor BrkB family protein [Coriobacteriia bacterium]
MPRPGAPAESFGRRIVRWVVGATESFLADDVPRMAAAMSYFLLLAIAPLVLLVNVVFGALGLATAGSTGAATIASAGELAAQGFAQATAWAGSYAPWAVAVLVIVGAVSVFGQFVDAVNRIWKTPPNRTPVRQYLRQRGMALALLGVAAVALVVALIVSGIVGIVLSVGLAYAQSLGVNLPQWSASGWLRAPLVFVASALLFAVAFVVAPDRAVRWRDALPGSLVTAVGFLIGEQVLSIYLGSTQRFVVFGASQFFVGLTVWIYYSAIVVLWGVEFTRMMVLDAESRRGERAESAAPSAPEPPAPAPEPHAGR